MDGKALRLPNAEQLKVFKHPLRFQLMAVLHDEEASPNDLAREVGEPVGNVAYHMRRLRDVGAIELVRTAQRRGATQHYYRATVRCVFYRDDWVDFAPAERRSLVSTNVRRIVARVVAALGRGGFDGADTHSAVVTLGLDGPGIEEMTVLTERFVTELTAVSHQAAERAAARSDGTPDPRTPFECCLAVYEVLPAPQPTPGDPPEA